MNELLDKLDKIEPSRLMGYVARFDELPKTVGEFKDKWGSYPIQWDMAIAMEGQEVMTKLTEHDKKIYGSVLANILETYDISLETLQQLLRYASKQVSFSDYREEYGRYNND